MPFLKTVNLFSSLVKTFEHIQVVEENLTSKTEITSVEEKMETALEERQIREEEVSRLQERTITETADDWFVLLNIIPRETPYVPPGIPKIPQHSFLLVLCFLLS